MPESAEVMHTSSLDRLGAFLAGRPHYYDTVWIARTHNLTHARPILLRAIAEGTLTARIVLDTEAVTPHREAMQAMLVGDVYDLLSAMQAILADADICDEVVAVTPAEADTLRCHALRQVSVVGHMIDPSPTLRHFDQRAGMLFVGAIHRADGPNLDSLQWFVDAVLPLIEAELGWETRLTIAGYVAPGIDLARFAHHPRITLRGQLADIDPLYNAHRVFVAPTRFAAGAPYKVLEAASRGLPVVATDVLCHQLEWQPAAEIMTAAADDPAGFAASVVRLYRDAALWQSIRDGALRRLQQDNRREAFVDAVRSVLVTKAGPADPKVPSEQRLVEKNHRKT
jgi:glycosyltransferase involved in cell wall biosynthesis